MDPVVYESRLRGDEGERWHSARGAARVLVLDSLLADNAALGSTAEPAFGGALYLHAAGQLSLERSTLSGNRVEGEEGEGGGIGVLDGGVVYLRDCHLLRSRAGYGAALRVRTQTAGVASVLLDNVTLAHNNASRFGSVVAVHAHSRVRRVPFLFRAGRYYYSLDPDSFRSRTLLRFGFNGDPYMNPYEAGLAPHGTNIQAFNPYEDEHHVLELPPDPRLTDQWPFWSTGQRHAPYLDARTVPGQKAASGGLAFLLGSEGSGRKATLKAHEYDGVVAFKDCNVFDNRQDLQAACYWDSTLHQHSCLTQTTLL